LLSYLKVCRRRSLPRGSTVLIGKAHQGREFLGIKIKAPSLGPGVQTENHDVRSFAEWPVNLT
jgi:hypothetical protein